MTWWNEFVTWLQTVDGHRSVFLGTVVFVAVIVGVVITGLIVSSAVKRLLAQHHREQKNNVIATLVDAATEAAAWKSLPTAVQLQSDRASAQAETLLRLSPIKGSGIAANWAAHELERLKGVDENAAGTVTVAEFRDRLIEWRNKPGRARKRFIADLERWSYLDTATPAADPATSLGTVEQPAAQPVAIPEAETVAATAPVQAPAAKVVEPTPVASTPAPARDSEPDEAPAASTDEITTPPAADPTIPTIALATPSGRAASHETEQLLADIDALEVRGSRRQVEEFSPVGAPSDGADTGPSAPIQRRESSGSEPQGTL